MSGRELPRAATAALVLALVACGRSEDTSVVPQGSADAATDAAPSADGGVLARPSCTGGAPDATYVAALPFVASITAFGGRVYWQDPATFELSSVARDGTDTKHLFTSTRTFLPFVDDTGVYVAVPVLGVTEITRISHDGATKTPIASVQPTAMVGGETISAIACVGKDPSYFYFTGTTPSGAHGFFRMPKGGGALAKIGEGSEGAFQIQPPFLWSSRPNGLVRFDLTVDPPTQTALSLTCGQDLLGTDTYFLCTRQTGIFRYAIDGTGEKRFEMASEPHPFPRALYGGEAIVFVAEAKGDASRALLVDTTTLVRARRRLRPQPARGRGRRRRSVRRRRWLGQRRLAAIRVPRVAPLNDRALCGRFRDGSAAAPSMKRVPPSPCTRLRFEIAWNFRFAHGRGLLRGGVQLVL
ncbi:MAG: hypothetical protein QM702_20830 [Rubrivivax sp.]